MILGSSLLGFFVVVPVAANVKSGVAFGPDADGAIVGTAATAASAGGGGSIGL